MLSTRQKIKKPTTGVQWGGGEGDRQVVGEDLHRWQDQVEAQEAGSDCLLVTQPDDLSFFLEPLVAWRRVLQILYHRY